jgi:hypothetical protein
MNLNDMNYIIVNQTDSFWDKMWPVFIGALLAFLSGFLIQYFKNKYDKKEEIALLKNKQFSELNYLDTYLTSNLHFYTGMTYIVLNIKDMISSSKAGNKNLSLSIFGEAKPEKLKNTETLAFTHDKPDILNKIFNIYIIMDRLHDTHIHLFDENIKKYADMPDNQKTKESKAEFIDSIEYVNSGIYNCLCKIIRDTSFAQDLVRQYCESKLNKKLPTVQIPIADLEIIKKAISDADKVRAI